MKFILICRSRCWSFSPTTDHYEARITPFEASHSKYFDLIKTGYLSIFQLNAGALAGDRLLENPTN
jgi:hypothetical protein